MFREMRAGSDAGQHQQLRRLDRARRDDDLAPARADFAFAALPVFDANSAPAVEQNARGQRIGFDTKVAAMRAGLRKARAALERTPLR